MKNSRSLSPEARGRQAILGLVVLTIVVSLLFGYLGATGKIKANSNGNSVKARPGVSAITTDTK